MLLLIVPLAPWLAPSEAAPARVSPLLHLQYARFDPLTSADAPVLAMHTPLIASWQPQTYIVQFHTPIREAWKQALVAYGVRLYGSIPDYALLTRMDAATAARIQQLPTVRWVGPYLPAYRIDPLFWQRGDELAPDVPLELTIATLPDTNLAALSHRLHTWQLEVLGGAWNRHAGYLSVRALPGYVPAIAALDGVTWVEAADVLALHNDQGGTAIVQADSVRQQLQLHGNGQIIAMADSGLDTGALDTLHPDLRGRVLGVETLGRPGDWSDPTGHGTHMAGSAVGNGSLSGSDPAGQRYDGSFAGVAPAASLFFQSIGDANGGIEGVPRDRGTLMRNAYVMGARIHSNSWGGHTGGFGNPPDFGRYTISSRQVDAVAWDLPDMLILYSAGNEGRDTDRNGVVDPDGLTQPGTAKNALTVGASESIRFTVPSAYGSAYGSPIDRDLYANDVNGMGAFSSRGPTDDGRIKPDIVAPGTFIASLQSHSYPFSDTLESELQGYTQRDTAGGTTSWQAVLGSGRNGSTGWQQTIEGSHAPGASTMLVTPPFDVSASPLFDITFWHRYLLGPNDRVQVILLSANAQDSNSIASHVLELPVSGIRESYSQYILEGISHSRLQQYGINPAALQLGFQIVSADNTFAATWTLDELRIDPADWGTLGKYRLTERGSALDESYVMLGGTSSATALTAGAAALVREWLVTVQELTNPSAALLKALLINGTASMGVGQYGTDTVQELPTQSPNAVNGWGRLDLLPSLQPRRPAAGVAARCNAGHQHRQHADLYHRILSSTA
ncbi:MAG: S8 family serine peptidase, partial [Chloroflexaceae bacterium]|nr:S8 family serine peptidase [Chloroflexaceae bacterium]